MLIYMSAFDGYSSLDCLVNGSKDNFWVKLRSSALERVAH
jgi:hypothetical protein